MLKTGPSADFSFLFFIPPALVGHVGPTLSCFSKAFTIKTRACLSPPSLHPLSLSQESALSALKNWSGKDGEGDGDKGGTEGDAVRAGEG